MSRLHVLPPEFDAKKLDYIWYKERVEQMGRANLYSNEVGWLRESHNCFRFLAQWKENKLPFRLLKWNR